MSMQTICNDIAKKIGAVKQKGYEEGFAAGQASGGSGDMSAWWDAFQQNGSRRTYTFAFSYAGWNDTTFKPKYDMIASGYVASMFQNTAITDVAKRLEDCGVVLNTEKATSFDNFCAYSTVTCMPTLDLSSATNAKNLFKNCASLTKAPLRNVSAVPNWTTAFDGCTNLTDIGQENDDFGYFSASVDLSKTAINFGTPKMCLHNLLAGDWVQSDSYLSLSKDCTLTISQKQLDDANNYLAPKYNGATFDVVVTEALGWTFAVV